MVWTDLRADEHGFYRFLSAISVFTIGRRDARCNGCWRSTYSTMALLALPPAQEAIPRIGRSEAALSKITQARSAVVRNLTDERALLAEITALAGEVERLQATTSYRFSACRAYYELVLTRLTELREQRVDGYQRLSAFLDRRLGQPMRTCRVGRQSPGSVGGACRPRQQFVAHRVDVAFESQNQDLLQSMNRRAQLQLRLQATVEGLSVAAISYYVVGLIGSAAKALKVFIHSLQPDLVMGIAIPFVAAIVWRGVRHVRRIANRDEKTD